jgi:AcrR family transcriptional regulator
VKNKRLISKEKNRKKIINAMETLLKKKNYSEITIRGLSSEANVSVGLIYKNFPNTKAEIVGEIFKKSMKEMDTLKKLKIDPSTPEKFRLYIRKSIEFLVDNHKKNRSINEALELAYLSNPDLRHTLKPLLKAEVNYFSDLIITLSNKGIISIPDPKNWSFWLVQLIDSMIHRYLVYELTTNDDNFLTVVSEIVFRSLNFKLINQNELFNKK